jgi:hypothetical protein
MFNERYINRDDGTSEIIGDIFLEDINIAADSLENKGYSVNSFSRLMAYMVHGRYLTDTRHYESDIKYLLDLGIISKKAV